MVNNSTKVYPYVRNRRQRARKKLIENKKYINKSLSAKTIHYTYPGGDLYLDISDCIGNCNVHGTHSDQPSWRKECLTNCSKAVLSQ